MRPPDSFIWILLLGVLSCIDLPESNAKTLYLSVDGDGSDGLSWATAFNDNFHGIGEFEGVLLAAEEGDNIWVKEGEYYGFDLNKGVSMYGGFSGMETALEDRDRAKHETIVRTGTYSIVSIYSGNVILDGFTITNCNCQGAALNVEAPAEIRNCKIIDNSSYGGSGAGVTLGYGEDTTIRLINCLIARNHIGEQYGISSQQVLIAVANTILVNCTISDNYNDGYS
jgi:hypothetical protein